MSNELATLGTDQRLPAPVHSMTFGEMQAAAKVIAASGMFACKTPEQALTLMMLCDAEGIHPIQALRTYHIIEGRPAMRADAMQARFERAGGKVKWIERTNDACEVELTAPDSDPLRFRWTMKDAETAGLAQKSGPGGGPGMYKKYPRQMLSARVISEGVRTVMPGIVSGIYTPEELMDMDEPKPKRVVSRLAPAAGNGEAAAGSAPEAPEPQPAADEARTTADAKAAAMGRGITPAEFEANFPKLVQKLGGWGGFDEATGRKIISAISAGEADKWKSGAAAAGGASGAGSAAPLPAPESDPFTAALNGPADQFKTFLIAEARKHGHGRADIEAGLAKWLTAGGATIETLTVARREELAEAVVANVVNWKTGQMREAVGAA